MTPEFVDEYLRSFSACLAEIPRQTVTAVGECLLDAFDRSAWVFLAGNGGSAALASHFACDLEKTTAGRRPREVDRRFRVQALADNLASLTAWSNDEGYEHVFAESLRSRASERDVLIVISASGNSPNIVAALEQARRMGVRTVGWLGFDGGRAKAMCDHALHVRSHDYGVVEAAHGVFTHLITDWLRQQFELPARHDLREVG
ncbi:MAG: SIS domain-containing protein [Myxococcales bacterium FL481]|nr:MAG: SIS domain-containing protein [Myxococcales bacterium FL481]